jgi:membrane protein
VKLAGRLSRATSMILSRDVAVLTNAIAFNFLLCLFPLVLVLAAVSQQMPGGRQLMSTLLLVLEQIIPFGHTSLAGSLKSLSRLARGLEVLALVLIVWGSSGIFMPVEMVLNRAWGRRAYRPFLASRVLAFFMTLAGALLVLASVALTILVRSYRAELPGVAAYAARLVAFLLTFAVFALIYRFATAPAIPWRAALRAAAWGGGAWEAAKYLFVVQLGRMHLEAFYGPLAFAVSLLLWAWVSSLALVFGALMAPPAHSRR